MFFYHLYLVLLSGYIYSHDNIREDAASIIFSSFFHSFSPHVKVLISPISKLLAFLNVSINNTLILTFSFCGLSVIKKIHFYVNWLKIKSLS